MNEQCDYLSSVIPWILDLRSVIGKLGINNTSAKTDVVFKASTTLTRMRAEVSFVLVTGSVVSHISQSIAITGGRCAHLMKVRRNHRNFLEYQVVNSPVTERFRLYPRIVDEATKIIIFTKFRMG